MKLDAGLMTSLPAFDPGSAAVWGSKRINPRPQSCLCLAWSDTLQTTTTTIDYFNVLCDLLIFCTLN